MRIWDIADTLFPGEPITEFQSRPPRINGLLSSAAHFALAVTFAVGTSTNLKVARDLDASNLTPTVHIVTERAQPAGETGTTGRQRLSLATDTQMGMSTPKLATLFEAYFQQAPEEEASEDEYSF